MMGVVRPYIHSIMSSALPYCRFIVVRYSLFDLHCGPLYSIAVFSLTVLRSEHVNNPSLHSL